MFLGTAAYVSRARGQGLGADRRSSRILLGARRAAAARAGCRASLAIRRQGIYFAMITLALAQMVFFFCLQAPFTRGEDGIQAVPRGKLFGFFDLVDDLAMYYVVLAIFLAGFLLIYRIDPLAVRPGAEGDPRERAARDLARLRRRPLQAARVRAVGGAGRASRAATKAIVFQLASLTDVHWTMSGEVVLMTLLGGMGTIFGRWSAPSSIITMENYLAAARRVGDGHAGRRSSSSACWLFRRGIVGEIGALLKAKS